MRPSPLRTLALAAAVSAAASGTSASEVGTELGDLPFALAVASSAAVSPETSAFYRERAFAPLWMSGDAQGQARIEALLGAMSRASDHALPTDRFDPTELRARILAARTADEMGRAEAELTETFLAFAVALSSGVTRPREIDPVTMPRDVPTPDTRTLLDAMASGDPNAVLRGLIPDSPEYVRLMKHKVRLEAVVASGGWGAPIPASRLEPGDRGPAVVALRARLQAKGLLGRSVSAVYDAEMEAAVRRAQTAMGLDADGIAGPDTIAGLNVPAIDRLAQVVVAMERERWLPDGRGEGREIWVNLPTFETVVFDDGVETFRTVSVIGKAVNGRYTPEFSDEMDHMVINPTWYVPRSIAVRDYLPRLRANPYAASYMRITDSRGREVSRARGFSQYTASNFPFAMRQPPGPKNALGFVKFMFPNEHAIYLHDSPAKSLYERDVRDFSSGCIRLKRPFEFAYHLLARQEDDPKRYFQSILRSGNERRVNLEAPIPVHLVYRTAFTDVRGGLHFRKDIYGRDAKVLSALRAAGVEIGAPVRVSLAALPVE